MADAIADDLAHRDARSDLTHFRLRFEEASDAESDGDSVELSRDSLELRASLLTK